MYFFLSSVDINVLYSLNNGYNYITHSKPHYQVFLHNMVGSCADDDCTALVTGVAISSVNFAKFAMSI